MDVFFQASLFNESMNLSLVQMMACCLLGDKPIQTIWWIAGNKLQWNLNRNIYISCMKMHFNKSSAKLSTILFRPQCVKTSSASPVYIWVWVGQHFAFRCPSTWHCQIIGRHTVDWKIRWSFPRYQWFLLIHHVPDLLTRWYHSK